MSSEDPANSHPGDQSNRRAGDQSNRRAGGRQVEQPAYLDGLSPEMIEVDRVLRALRPTVEMVDGVAVARFEPQAEHRGNPGWLHGGLAAAVLDHVCARAAAAALGQRVVTGRLDLRYPQPVLLADGPYQVEAEAERTRGRMVRVTGAILDHQGHPMVEARSLFVTLP